MALNRRNHVDHEELSLSKAAHYLLEECRMVLPGIQALFGFQLMVVFNSGFSDKLSIAEQHIHLAAMALVILAIGLIMAPAAYHRQRGPREVTSTFVRLASALLLLGMGPLAVAICAEFYLAGRVISGRRTMAFLAALLFAFFVTAWFVLPRLQRLLDLAGAHGLLPNAHPKPTTKLETTHSHSASRHS